MNNSNFAQKIKERESKQLRSASTQRLLEKLSLIRNRRELYRKRWFWELLQNASDYNDSVNVQLVVDKEKIVFKHDGMPFLLSDVFNIIRPDSNKKDDDRRKDSIGKFGSGLVSTHILSSHIRVEGYAKDDEDLREEVLYKFETDVDRKNYQTKSLLMADIDDSIDNFAHSLTSTVYIDGFNTSFTYYLNEQLPDINAISYADIDLDYLYQVLPYTLCFMPKILSVKIFDNRNQESTYYIKRSSKSDSETIIFNTSKNDGLIEEVWMKYFENDEVSSCFHIKDNKIMPFPKGISKLFCGLPLIGTERTGLPLIANSLEFEPTTEREGVEIDPSCDKQNIRILSSFIKLYKEILDYIEKNEILNAYEIVGLSNEYNGTYESKENFKDNIVGKFKELVLSHAILQNVYNSFIKVSDARIPVIDKKTSKELYEFAKVFDSNILPLNYSGWQRNLKFYDDLAYTYGDLAERIQNTEYFESLEKIQPNSRVWLKECVRFLLNIDKNVCSDYEILPNQNGYFHSKEDLYLDKKLPAQLKRINEQTEDVDDRLSVELLNPNFNTLVELKEYTKKELANRIDENIKSIYTKNKGKIPEQYESCINSLYSWTKEAGVDDDTLLSYFPWFFPKRASLIADLMTDEERNQSLKIVRSGKMESLSILAESDLTEDEIRSVADNINIFRSLLVQIQDKVDDKTFANQEEGDWGESVVWEDLKQKYTEKEGYNVVWASRDESKPEYDFRIERGDEIICYCDAKTTSRGLGNSDSIPFFMRKSQWTFLDKLEDSIPYYIARVFISDNNQVKYLRISKKKNI